MSESLEQTINRYIYEGWGFHKLKKEIRDNWNRECYAKAKKYLKKCRAKGLFK